MSVPIQQVYFISEGLFVSTQEAPTVSGMRCIIRANEMNVVARMHFEENTVKRGDPKSVGVKIQVLTFGDLYVGLLEATNALSLIHQNMTGISTVMGSAYLSGLFK